MKVLQGHENEVVGVVFSPDSRVLATSGRDRTIRIWDLPPDLSQAALRTTKQWAFRADGLAFSKTGAELAAGQEDGKIQLWKVGQGLEAGPVLDGHTAVVTALAYSADGKALASGSTDGKVICRSTENNQVILTIDCGKPIEWFSFAPNNDKVAVVAGDCVKFFDPQSGQELGKSQSDHPLRCVTFQRNYSYGTAYAGDGAEVVVEHGTQVAKRLACPGKVFWVGYTPNGRMIAATCSLNEPLSRLVWWSAESGSFGPLGEMQKTAPFSRLPGAIAISPNCSLAAAGTRGGEVYVWAIN